MEWGGSVAVLKCGLGRPTDAGAWWPILRVPYPTISINKLHLFAQEMFEEFNCALKKKVLLQVGSLRLGGETKVVGMHLCSVVSVNKPAVYTIGLT